MPQIDLFLSSKSAPIFNIQNQSGSLPITQPDFTLEDRKGQKIGQKVPKFGFRRYHVAEPGEAARSVVTSNTYLDMQVKPNQLLMYGGSCVIPP